jgi:hypothetical protein
MKRQVRYRIVAGICGLLGLHYVVSTAISAFLWPQEFDAIYSAVVVIVAGTLLATAWYGWRSDVRARRWFVASVLLLALSYGIIAPMMIRQHWWAGLIFFVVVGFGGYRLLGDDGGSSGG